VEDLEKQFPVGCRVAMIESSYIGSDCPLSVGDTGTVAAITSSFLVAVNWDVYHPILHVLGSLCEDGHGWFIGPEKIVRINVPQNIDELDAMKPIPVPTAKYYLEEMRKD